MGVKCLCDLHSPHTTHINVYKALSLQMKFQHGVVKKKTNLSTDKNSVRFNEMLVQMSQVTSRSIHPNVTTEFETIAMQFGVKKVHFGVCPWEWLWSYL